jgi:hypothetical protein
MEDGHSSYSLHSGRILEYAIPRCCVVPKSSFGIFYLTTPKSSPSSTLNAFPSLLDPSSTPSPSPPSALPSPPSLPSPSSSSKYPHRTPLDAILPPCNGASFAMHGHLAFLDASYPGVVSSDLYVDMESVSPPSPASLSSLPQRTANNIASIA